MEGQAMKDGVFVEHLLAEHRRLDHLISQTMAALPGWDEIDAWQWLPRLVEGLNAIRHELAQHFHEEEDGGCLEEAVSRCPGLSSEVARVESEHAKLLADLDELIRRAQPLSGSKPDEARVLGQKLRAIVLELHAHEALENQIMARGFGRSLENEDMAQSS